MVLLLAVILPCTVRSELKSPPQDGRKTRLAVLPFQVILPDDPSTTVRCPVCGHVHSAGSIAPGAQSILEAIFIDKLKGVDSMDLLSPDKAAGVYQRESAISLKKPLIEVLLAVGRELNADVVAVGYVYRYRERVGYDYAAERPASVAYEIHLLSVKDGISLWRGIFDHTQKSLMEDVFQASTFFRGGAKWLTARELSKLGMDEIFKSFPPGSEP